MDKNTLVDEEIQDGQRLLGVLSQIGFEVTAAFWLHASEDDQWYFYLVTPLVDTLGLAQAYRRLHPLVRALPQPCWIDPLAIKLIGPGDPIAIDALLVHSRAPGPATSPTRWAGRRLGNVAVEGAYLYPLPTPTAA